MSRAVSMIRLFLLFSFRFRTKDLSILRLSRDNSINDRKDEYPVPKSSIETPTPVSRSSPRILRGLRVPNGRLLDQFNLQLIRPNLPIVDTLSRT